MNPSSLTQAELVNLLHYDAETGKWTWLKSGKGRKLRIAGNVNSEGYRIIMIGGRRCKSARLAWLYVHGRWPKEQIDHIR